MRAVCEDLKMQFIDSLSLDIADLHNDASRRTLGLFARTFAESILNGHVSPIQALPLPVSTFIYQPGPDGKHVALDSQTRLLIITEAGADNPNERAMVKRFRSAIEGGKVTVVNLRDVPLTRGCRGCMQCGYDYTCAVKDGFTEFYNETVKEADILVFCGTVRGRYLSSRWKMFFDRAFFWNHTPSLRGRQIAYLISGPLKQNPHLTETLEATVTARQQANLAGIVTDEAENSANLDKLIDSLAMRVATYSGMDYVAPQNFLAVGGHKIFRDEIWGKLRAVWQADYRHYKRNGMFDFPQKKWLFRFAGAATMLFSNIPIFRKRFYRMLRRCPPVLVRIVDRYEP